MNFQLENIQSQKEEKVNIFFNIAYFVVYYFLSAVLTFSGLAGIYDPFSFLESIRIFLPLPTNMVIAFVSLIIVMETVLGLSLLLRLRVKQNLIIAALLLFGILVLSIYCYSTGIQIDSGSFGGISENIYSPSTIMNNSVFFLTALSLVIKENVL